MIATVPRSRARDRAWAATQTDACPWRAEMTTTPQGPGVAYLVSRYPALSHTFIEREVEALRAEGVRVETFTVRPAPSETLLTETMRSENARTKTLIGAGAPTWVTAHLDAIRRSPSAWFGTLSRSLRTGPLSPKSRLWQVFYFGEAGVLVHHMRRAGLRHVHAHFVNVASDVARLAADLGRRTDGPDAGWGWSFTMHGPTGFDAVREADLAAKGHDADGVMCISHYCRSQMMAELQPEDWDKLELVRMTVDADRYHPPATPRQHDGSVRILTVGRLVPEKGPTLLLEALRIVKDRGVDFAASLVGSGPLADELETRRRELGLEDVVTLTGPIGQDRLPDMYREADIFAMASFQEGLPVVYMEALATELPVVATAIAATGELVVDDVTGRLIPPGDAVALADALEDLARNPEKRARLGRAGREAVVAQFTPATAGPAAARFFDRGR